MLEPRISVIVPVYNREQTIETCVNGILSSQYRNIEVIIVDDGSWDNTFNLCKQIVESDNRVVVIRQENKGVSAARNAALDIASGEWVTFVDSDDTINPLCYSHLNGGGYLRNCDLIMFGVGVLNNKKEILPVSGLGLQSTTINSREAIVNYLFGEFNPYMNTYFCVWDKLFRKSIIDSNNIRFESNVTLGEDQIFVLNYISYTKSFHYESKPFALKLHWKRGERVSSLGVSLRSPEEFIFIQRRNYSAFDRLLNIEPNAKLKDYQVNYIIDRPITRILYRYVLLENWRKYPYSKLKKFTELYILPTLRMERANMSKVRDQRTIHIANMLFDTPFIIVYTRLAISKNAEVLSLLMMRFLRKIEKFLKIHD